jgi:hypothetical protein
MPILKELQPAVDKTLVAVAVNQIDRKGILDDPKI